MNAHRPPLYLDWNATTPLLPEVVAEMLDTMQHAWANPSSVHAPGQAARRVLADARARVARGLDALSSEVVFTSGATEANHFAVWGALGAARANGRRRWVLSAVEHPGLLALADRLRAEGTPVDLIPVDDQGQLDLAAADALIGPDTALVSVMGANNETGVLMPAQAVAALAHAQGAWLHVDATQLMGKSKLSFAGLGADLMVVSAHKIGGPKGAGALLVRKGLAPVPLIAGRQERQRRGGTENLPAIAGFAAACDHVAATLAGELAAMERHRRRLEQGILQALPSTRLLGAGVARLPNTACFIFGALDADLVLARLERAGVVVSSGAACSAGGTQPSHVLLAMGLGARLARAGVRYAIGRDTTGADIEFAIAATVRVLQPLMNDAESPPTLPVAAAEAA
jgi:cysteine desulfurase